MDSGLDETLLTCFMNRRRPASMEKYIFVTLVDLIMAFALGCPVDCPSKALCV